MKIETTETQVIVTSDYNAEFVSRARNLSGKWSSPSWIFDIRNEAAVRAACLECYGTDGMVTDTVDVRVTLHATNYSDHHSARTSGITVFGRTVARAFGRDSGATLGDGVVVESGKFSSGGSAKNWETRATAGTKVILRNVSRALVDAHDDESVSVEIITSNVDADALRSEREKLIARIAEINTILGE